MHLAPLFAFYDPSLDPDRSAPALPRADPCRFTPAQQVPAAPATTVQAPAQAEQATPGAAAAPVPAVQGQPKRGGAMTVVYKDDLATLDPAIGYDWTNWPADQDGLRRPARLRRHHQLDARAWPPKCRQVSADGQRLHLQAAPGRQVPERPRIHRRRRGLHASPACSTPRRPAPAPASSSASRAPRNSSTARRPPWQASRPSTRYTVEFTLEATRCDLPEQDGAQLRLHRAEGRGGEGRARTSAISPSAPDPSRSKSGTSGQYLTFERNPNYFYARPALPGPGHHRGRRGPRTWRCCGWRKGEIH